MAISGGFFALVYFACVIGIIIFVLWSINRFVNAHERVATALENIARKLRDGDTKS
jgi:flagellar biogenesis protein FliO